MPSDVRIKIENSEILINFNINNIFEKKSPTGFMIILAQYDYNKKNMNNNKFYVSNEYELSSSVSIDLQNYQTNICSLDNGNPICEYKFKNWQIRDDKNKLYSEATARFNNKGVNPRTGKPYASPEEA